MSLIKLMAIAVAAVTVSPVSSRSTLAQSLDPSSDSFSIPSTLPDGTTLKVDGSTSMRVTNELLESRFEQQYDNVDVELAASRTDEAFEALINGDIDLLATGRPLTLAEKAQGVVEVPLEQREKLAIFVGSDNPFKGDLTFEQFAQIFRGEITNWSELGGPDLPIRLVDRPDYSDTRRALGTYSVFEGQPFQSGPTATPVPVDETDSVVETLGNDGIGYGVVSQVLGREDVRIVPMHQTLPDDPRYPYSQYRAFAYKEGASPATLAFLGLATTAPGSAAISAGSIDPASGAAGISPTVGSAANPGSDDSPATDDSVLPSAPTGAAGDAAAGDAAAGAAPTAAAGDATSGDVAVGEAAAGDSTSAAGAASAGATQGEGGFPWWLLPLLAIPLLGGLLWWLLKGSGSTATAGGGSATTAAAATVLDQSRLVLTPRDHQHAYAYWEIPQERLAAAKRQGGETMAVRLYDVTGRSKSSPLPPSVDEFPCMEANPDLHLPVAMGNRSYCAEVGYLTSDRQWLPLTRSEQVRVPAPPEGAVPAAAGTASPDTGLAQSVPDNVAANQRAGSLGAAAALGGAALAGAAALGASQLSRDTDDKAAVIPEAHMVLTQRSADSAYAQWEISPAQMADAKLRGGETLALNLYDVTDRLATAPLPNPVSQMQCAEADTDAHFAITPERSYIAEVGYQTADGNWLPLAQTPSVKMLASIAESSQLPGAAVVGAAAVGAAARQNQGTTQTVKVHSRNNALMFDEGQLHHIEHSVARTYGLSPAVYTLRIKEGVFNYDGDDTHPGEPFVLLWIHGGTVINEKTKVPVSSTWTTLNGYDDTLTLDVREPATLCAFFLDTYPDDNTGEITLTVTQQ